MIYGKMKLAVNAIRERESERETIGRKTMKMREFVV